MSNDLRPEVAAALERQRQLDAFLREQGLSPQSPLAAAPIAEPRPFRQRPLSADQTIDSHTPEEEALRQRVVAGLPAEADDAAADAAEDEAEFETWADRDAAGDD